MKSVAVEGGKFTIPAKVVIAARNRGSIALALQLLLLGLLVWKTISAFQASFQFRANTKREEEWKWSKVRITFSQSHFCASREVCLTVGPDYIDERSHMACML